MCHLFFPTSRSAALFKFSAISQCTGRIAQYCVGRTPAVIHLPELRIRLQSEVKVINCLIVFFQTHIRKAPVEAVFSVVGVVVEVFGEVSYRFIKLAFHAQERAPLFVAVIKRGVDFDGFVEVI